MKRALLCILAGLLAILYLLQGDRLIRHTKDSPNLGSGERSEPFSPNLANQVFEIAATRDPVLPTESTLCTLSGRVLDAQTGLPVPYASIEATIAGHLLARAWASQKGDYHLSLPRASYTVRSSAFGYQVTELDVVIRSPEHTVANLRLVPKEETEVIVAWADGSPVKNASLTIVSDAARTVDDDRPAAPKTALLGSTDASGRAMVRIAVSTPLLARDEPSGCFGTAVGMPGRRCEIVLDPGGANFAFRHVSDVESLAPLRCTLRYLDDKGEPISVPLAGSTCPILLRKGRWVLRLDDGPFVLNGVYRDGDRIAEASQNITAFTILDSTKRIEVALVTGIRLRLVDGVSGEAITGEFSYRRRLQGSDRRWKDAHVYRSIADTKGRAELYPIDFSDSDQGTLSLRIDVPGYQSAVLTGGELYQALRESIRVEVRLEVIVPTRLLLKYPDGTPFQGLVFIEAIGADFDRELFVGAVAADGSVPPVELEEHEDVRISNWDRGLLTFLKFSDLRCGSENQITIDAAHAKIVIVNAPAEAPMLAVVGARGDQYSFTKTTDKLVSPPLYPGQYFVGPLQLAQKSRQLFSAFAHDKALRRGRVVCLFLESGTEYSVDWQEDWLENGVTSGSITVVGPIDRMVVVPIYTREGLQATFAPNMPRICLDDDGNYSVPPDMTPPDLLAVCSLDAFGYPVPLEFFRPGENAVVSCCSLRLERSPGLKVTETALVTFAINMSGFREHVEMPSNEYAAVWDVESPMEIKALPCGATTVWVRIGNRVFEKQAVLRAAERGAQVIHFP